MSTIIRMPGIRSRIAQINRIAPKRHEQLTRFSFENCRRLPYSPAVEDGVP